MNLVYTAQSYLTSAWFACGAEILICLTFTIGIFLLDFFFYYFLPLLEDFRTRRGSQHQYKVYWQKPFLFLLMGFLSTLTCTKIKKLSFLQEALLCNVVVIISAMITHKGDNRERRKFEERIKLCNEFVTI